MFSILQKYYDILWCKEDLNHLKSIFADNIELSFNNLNDTVGLTSYISKDNVVE